MSCFLNSKVRLRCHRRCCPILFKTGVIDVLMVILQVCKIWIIRTVLKVRLQLAFSFPLVIYSYRSLFASCICLEMVAYHGMRTGTLINRKNLVVIGC